MTTRAGTLYRDASESGTTMSSSSEADAEERTGTAGVPDVVRILLEDRRKRDDELAEERARRDEEQTRLTKRMEEQLHDETPGGGYDTARW